MCVWGSLMTPHGLTKRNEFMTLQEIHSLPTENSIGNINNSVGN